MERILVPLDGSHLSEAVLPLAEALARDHGAEILLLRVVHLHGLGGVVDPEIEIDRSGDAEEYLERLAGGRESEGSRAVRVSVATGKPDQVIVETAARERVDLIAMATHGRGGLARLLLGSVAEGVVRQAAAPVLLVRGQPSGGRADLGPILVCLDGSELSRGILPVAERLAGPFGCTIHLLHVIEPPAPSVAAEAASSLAEVAEQRRTTAEGYLSTVAAPLDARGVPVRPVIRIGPVVDAIQEYVRDQGIGLIAMTRTDSPASSRP